MNIIEKALTKALLEEIEYLKSNMTSPKALTIERFNPSMSNTCFLGLAFTNESQRQAYRETVGEICFAKTRWSGHSMTLLEWWSAENWVFNDKEVVTNVLLYLKGEVQMLPKVEWNI